MQHLAESKSLRTTSSSKDTPWLSTLPVSLSLLCGPYQTEQIRSRTTQTAVPCPISENHHIDCRVAIDLRKRRFGRSGQIVASCSLDLSSVTDKGEAADVHVEIWPRLRTTFIPAEICLELKGGRNNKFGELIICVVSSLTPTNDAAQNASQAAQQLHSGLAVVNDAIQATAPLATEITAQFNAWQPLLSRLAALVEIANTVAEVRFILNYLCPAITKTYLRTGSPLDQVSVGSRLCNI
jgi:hypothetical protein